MNSSIESSIKDILLKGNYLGESDFVTAEENAHKNKESVSEYLLNEGIITKDLLGQAISEYFNVSYARFGSENVSEELLALIPEAISKKHRIFVFSKTGDNISIATDNPLIAGDVIFGRLFPNQNIKIFYATPEDVNSIFDKSKEKLDVKFAKMVAENKIVAPTIVEEILDDAVLYRASDIHFEPNESGVRVRFRIDGQLKEIALLPKSGYDSVARVIKNRAGLSTDEHMKPQDGAIRINKNGTSVDIRISIIPTINGEKIVMRLLSEYVRNLSVTSLGMTAEDEALLMKISKNPFGMILTVGPTGSGKTTTLYSLIKTLNTPEINITTIEDPVEYKVDGVNHIQVNEVKDLTFAKGLRSIVRQDPNIIFVGEIRDKETAEIAANAALTGHLVLSTFHANDAATAFPRLLDMGIEPFLLSSTLEVVIGQRLVRRICESCRYSEELNLADLKKKFELAERYFADETITLYKGKGCPACNNTGFKGRVAIYELVYSTPELQNLILTSPSTAEVWKVAKKQGAHSMFEDGLVKIKSGLTTLEELLRVAQPILEDVYKK